MPTVLEQTADYILEELKNVTQQLTRLANQGEPQIKDGLVTHKIYRDTLEDIILLVRKSDMSIKDRTTFLNRFNETLDKARSSPPADDALVEAVKKIKSMKGGTYIHSGHEVLCNICSRMKKIASSTLAAHKKAVR